MVASKHVTKNLAFICLVVSIFLGCQGCEDEEVFTRAENTIQEIRSLVSATPGVITTATFTLRNLRRDTFLRTRLGSLIFLKNTENLFVYPDGKVQPCSQCNDLKIQVVEASKWGDFIARRLTNVDQKDIPLSTVGAIEITATCNGKRLLLAPNQNLLLNLQTKGNAIDLRAFYGEPSAVDSLIRWTEAPDVNMRVPFKRWYAPGFGFPRDSASGFELQTKRLGWLNAASRDGVGNANTTRKTYNCRISGEEFTPTNTIAYIYLEGFNLFVPLQYEPVEKNLLYRNAPMGYGYSGSGYIIVTISKIKDQYWLGVFRGQKEPQITNNFGPIRPRPVETNELLQDLRQL